MSWKKKQKELTPEEAIALAKQELAPFWHRVSPLFAGVRNEQGVSAFPLEPLFQDGSWLMVFADATDFGGEAAVHFAKEFNRRYQVFDLRLLLVLRGSYSFLKDREAIENYLERRQVTFPVVFDHDGSLSEAFRAGPDSAVALLTSKGIQVHAAGDHWEHEAELGIQRFLRSTDPGLPLLPVLDAQKNLARDAVKLEFGRDRGMNFPKPGFVTPAGNLFAADFPEGSASMTDGMAFAIGGKWAQDADRIATTDPKALISIHAPSQGVALLAHPLKKSVDGGRIVVEVNGIAAPDVYADADLEYDDEGRSLIASQEPRLYSALKKLGEKERNITFRFPFADQVPVALYGVRFWKLGF